MSRQPNQTADSKIVSLRPGTRPVVQFWYEFASTYSYLSAMRVQTLAIDSDVEIVWRPFLLGPIFKKQGWDTSPFNLHPAKGRYMWQDMERQCDRYGLPFTMPVPFPQHSLIAARIAYSGRQQSWIGAFTRAVYVAQFGQGLDISDEGLMVDLLFEAGAPVKQVLEESKSSETKIGLRAAVSEAEKLGIFGAPSFVLENGDLYWGDDRMEQALEVASRT
jgi:2-hydroxychromene-2-carboxylate isomerase